MLIDWFTVAAQTVNFLLLVWLLKRFLYQPVLAAIDKREKLIAIQIQDAEKKKAEAAREQIDLLKKNDEFDRQRAGLLLEATNSGKTEREKLLEKARTDSEELRSKLQKTVHDELDNLNGKIGTLAVEEVFSIARKTLAQLADVNLDERMTELFLRHLHDIDSQQIEGLKGSPDSSKRPVLVRSAFELAAPQKTAIEEGVKAILGDEMGIQYETSPGLISGIELTANGRKIAWSIADYLTSLTNSVHGLLEPKFDPALVPPKALANAA
jgi:F-type H+-transporting ATPase subunit b